MKSREQVEMERQLYNMSIISDEEAYYNRGTLDEEAQLEAERKSRMEADRRYDASIRRRLAVNQKKPSCRSHSRNTPCELVEGHKGLHLTTSDGGFGWWASEHQDPPNAWDKIIDGFGL